MKRGLEASLLGAFLVLAVTAEGETTIARRRTLVVAVETLESAVDGSGRRGCQAQVEVESGKEKALWISFGAVKETGEGGWEAVVPRTHCGSGSFEEVRRHLGRRRAIPYVILDLRAVPAVSAGRVVSLRATLALRKLSRFDRNGDPIYERGVDERTLRFGAAGDAIIPVLVSDARETEAFGVHDVFLRLRARTLGEGAAATYGTIAVTSDAPGAAILLDGGLVSRTSERGPTLLRNVLAGQREVRVRDYSGREAVKSVVVERDRIVEVALRVLDLATASVRNGLIPIGTNPQGHDEYWRVKDGAIVVRVPSGEFLMGSPEGEGEPTERPQHRVYVADFLIDKTEVTWRQLRRYAETTGVPLPPAPAWGTPEDYAASNILWAEAKAYCEWAGGRLPWEAEWEKGARGLDGRKYPWGNEWDPDRCNSWEGGPHRPKSVGSYPACVTPYGVLEMPGSVWEWCADRYVEGYPAESPSPEPEGPTSGILHVLRGGGWLNQATWLRSAYRYRGDLSSRNVHHGFRCAQDPPR